MRLSKNSITLKDLLLENNIEKDYLTKKTRSIVGILYNDILNAFHYLNWLKKKVGGYYHVHLKKISTVNDIPKPKNFNSNSFPPEIRKHIDETMSSQIIYRFSLFERKIEICFISEEVNIETNQLIYNNYLDLIIMWFYILNEYSSKKCSKKITVYLYLTSLEKKIPTYNFDILDEININSAFTTTCPVNSEIVVFRKEEWFKVLIHEILHLIFQI